MEKISPCYIIDLIDVITKELSSRYKGEKIERYLGRWDIQPVYRVEYYEYECSYNVLDIRKTLNTADDETLLKIAMDLGIETPGFLPMTPIFRNELKKDFPTASEAFERAFKLVSEDPNMAVSLANTTLESILKEIIKDDRVSVKYDNRKTTYALIKDLCKDFKSYAGNATPQEILTMNTSLIAVGEAVENLRSRMTLSHGKTGEDYIIDDPMYAYLIVNSVTTVGMFLKDFYQKKYPKKD